MNHVDVALDRVTCDMNRSGFCKSGKGGKHGNNRRFFVTVSHGSDPVYIE